MNFDTPLQRFDRFLRPKRALNRSHAAFRQLLDHNLSAHEAMATLQDWHRRADPVDFAVIKQGWRQLAAEVEHVLGRLNQLSAPIQKKMWQRWQSLQHDIDQLTRLAPEVASSPLVWPLAMLARSRQSLAGGKAAHLAQVIRNGPIPVPRAAVVSAAAFDLLIDHHRLRDRIDAHLAATDIQDPQTLQDHGRAIRELVLQAELPAPVADAVKSAFAHAGGPDGPVALRSSAVHEDSARSFAGVYHTCLDVTADNLATAYKSVLASKYSPEALYYRIRSGLADEQAPMAVVVQKMIAARVSGILYTRDVASTDNQGAVIHAVNGMGEALVGGRKIPTVYRFDAGAASGLKSTPADGPLTSVHLARLDQWRQWLVRHFGVHQDCEWCLDADDQLWLVQTRPLHDQRDNRPGLECHYDDIPNAVLVRDGLAAATGVGIGQVFVPRRASDLYRVPDGAVLVAEHASPSFVAVLHRLRAVVTEAGSTAGHLASVAREFGVPMIVGARQATAVLKPGRKVTVYADQCLVYDGTVDAMIDNPCYAPLQPENSPVRERLAAMLARIAPLRLPTVIPAGFDPEQCRSVHDLLRLAHETAVQTMFDMGDRRMTRRMGARWLASTIPLGVYLLDLGGGVAASADGKAQLDPDDVQCAPFGALWQGLSDPAFDWAEGTHFDWAAYDKMVMSGGIIKPEDPLLTSFAAVSADYMNFNIKFGYHFVIVDSHLGPRSEANHIRLRFAGGGADDDGRLLRADLVAGLLDRIGYTISHAGDTVDARIRGGAAGQVTEKLVRTGRLLAGTRLLDMRLKNHDQVRAWVERFAAAHLNDASGAES